MRDRGLQKQVEQVGRDGGGRFRKGHSGNPKGRPPKASAGAAAAVLDGAAEALTRKAVEMALAGDAAALRLCLDRVVGQRRGRPVALSGALALPAVCDARDLETAMNHVAQAATQGVLTPDEAVALSLMVESFARTLEAAHVVRKRIWRGKRFVEWLRTRTPEEARILLGEPPE